jgi:hypothetical protein
LVTIRDIVDMKILLSLIALLGVLASASAETTLQEHNLSFDFAKIPKNVDHEFYHHSETLQAIQGSKKKFVVKDIQNQHHGDAAAFAHLGLYKEEYRSNEEFLADGMFDTRTTYSLLEDQHYFDLNTHLSKDSNRKYGLHISNIDDDSVTFCGDNSNALDDVLKSVNEESMMVASADGHWWESSSDQVHQWIQSTEHLGPWVKSADTPREHKGFVIVRKVTNVPLTETVVSASGALMGRQKTCRRVQTETLHPMELFKQVDTESISFPKLADEALKNHLANGRSHAQARILHNKQQMSAVFNPVQNGRRLAYIPKLAPVRNCDNKYDATFQQTYANKLTENAQQWIYTESWLGKGKVTIKNGEYNYMLGATTGCISYSQQYDAFNFNYNTETQKASKPTINMIGTETSGLNCKQCYAYLGAAIFATTSYDTLNLQLRAMAKITGKAAASLFLEQTAMDQSVSKTGVITGAANDYITIPISGILALKTRLSGVKYAVYGGIKLTGSASVNGLLNANAAAGFAYGTKTGTTGTGSTSPSLYPLSDATYTYKAPQFTYNKLKLESASLTAAVSGIQEFKLSIGVTAFFKTFEVAVDFKTGITNYQGSLYKAAGSTATINLKLPTSCTLDTSQFPPVKCSRRRLDAAEVAAINEEAQPKAKLFRSGDVIPVTYDYKDLRPSTVMHLFVSVKKASGREINMYKHEFTTSATGSGQEVFGFHVPFSRALRDPEERDGDKLEHKLAIRCSDNMMKQDFSPVFHLDALSEDNTVFTNAELDGTHADMQKGGVELEPDRNYEVTWAPHLLNYFKRDDFFEHEGEIKVAKFVTFELVGERVSPQGKVLKRTVQPVDPQTTWANTGRATLSFPRSMTSPFQGHRFFLRIRGDGRASEFSVSRNYIRFSLIDEATNDGLPLVHREVHMQDLAMNMDSVPSTKYASHYLLGFMSQHAYDESTKESTSDAERKRKLAVVTAPSTASLDVTYTCTDKLQTVTKVSSSAGNVGASVPVIGRSSLLNDYYTATLQGQTSNCATLPSVTADTSNTPAPTPSIAPSLPVPAPTPAVPNPPAPAVPKVPVITEQQGWIKTCLYDKCPTSANNPKCDGAFLQHFEPIGLCRLMASTSSVKYYALTSYTAGSGQVQEWFFSDAACTKPFAVAGTKYEVTSIPGLTSCQAFGNHFAETQWLKYTKGVFPTSDFTGAGYIFWNDKNKCNTKENIGYYQVVDGTKCYKYTPKLGTQQFGSRQFTCPAVSNGMAPYTKMITYAGSTAAAQTCTAASASSISTSSFNLFNCAATSGNNMYTPSAGTGIVSPVMNLGLYKTSICGTGIPESFSKNSGTSSGTSSSSSNNNDSESSPGVIAASVLGAFLAIALVVIAYQFVAYSGKPQTHTMSAYPAANSGLAMNPIQSPSATQSGQIVDYANVYPAKAEPGAPQPPQPPQPPALKA